MWLAAGHGRCVCDTQSHVRLLSSALLSQNVQIPSFEYRRTGVRWIMKFKSHKCQYSTTDGVPPGGNELSRDGRPLCPRCGEPFSGTFSTMSKSSLFRLVSKYFCLSLLYKFSYYNIATTRFLECSKCRHFFFYTPGSEAKKDSHTSAAPVPEQDQLPTPKEVSCLSETTNQL